MSTGWHCLAAAAVVVAMTFGVSASAQDNPCVSGNMPISARMGGVQFSKNQPFSGTVKTSFEQKLADGNAIHNVWRSHNARDSSGRTMTETLVGCAPGDDGQMHAIVEVDVYDPVARTQMNWQVGNDNQPKVVHVIHQSELPLRPPVTRPQPDPAAVERQQRAMQAAQMQEQQRRIETQTENLGTKDFNGIPADGTRSTRTIPAGKEGNDQPLQVIDENWRLKELGLMLMLINDDPRRGRTTMEYEELTRGEPDPSLFALPAGYTVQDQTHP